jgi:glycosyltransferase involved in cell wall biosynthesis
MILLIEDSQTHTFINQSQKMNFSIVITTYQRRDGSTPFFLKRAIDSVMNQDYQKFKIYVIGDKYEDNTEFESLFATYPKDKIYYENLPEAKERDKYTDKWLIWLYAGCFANNYGINKSVSDGFEYVCHLDHDDEWYPDHLSSLNNAITHTGALWLCTKSEYVNNSILPSINDGNMHIPFLPEPERLIHSSTCINFKKIPLRHRNVYEETGKRGLPGDADLWYRMKEYLTQINQTGCLVNKITCKHIEEGYERR